MIPDYYEGDMDDDFEFDDLEYDEELNFDDDEWGEDPFEDDLTDEELEEGY